ncbi:hypothetical protein BJX61DRAFT_546957 [Aspergillus egyptiacus]|nr:hypothetical protein BJX61DRAFT_546957 [Aspergillus egyptiacus]
MSWTPESNAKLLIGILQQLKDQNVKLNYQTLAEYMGPECNRKSIENQMTKLKKQAAQAQTQDQDPEKSGTGAGASEMESSATASVAPKKKRGGNSAGGKGGRSVKRAKKAEIQGAIEPDNEGHGEENGGLNEVKEEMEGLD